jgi:hypothetical protein
MEREKTLKIIMTATWGEYEKPVAWTVGTSNSFSQEMLRDLNNGICRPLITQSLNQSVEKMLDEIEKKGVVR